MSAVATAYTPADPYVIARELDRLTDVIDHVALAIRAYAQHVDSDAYPIHPVIAERLMALYAAQRRCG